jgi:Fe-S-cluster containining protein
LQCGKCCRSLSKFGADSGLSLFEEESELFPEKKVFPRFGIGESPDSSSFKVVLYQYIDDICIYLVQSLCSIHETRPLACRSYPFRFSVQGREKPYYSVAPECSAIENSGILDIGSASILENMEVKAAREIGYRLLSINESPNKGESIWRYSITDKMWKKRQVTG